MNRLYFAGLVALSILFMQPSESRLIAQEVTVQSLPPVVVSTVPTAGDENVDTSITEIKVSFSKPMRDQTWSWGKLTDGSFPEIDKSKPLRYDADKKTAILPVRLEKNKTYAIWVNTSKLQNFRDDTGLPAVPYLLVFKTGS